eukprot:816838-Amphidinium_carterae.1
MCAPKSGMHTPSHHRMPITIVTTRTGDCLVVANEKHLVNRTHQEWSVRSRCQNIHDRCSNKEASNRADTDP